MSAQVSVMYPREFRAAGGRLPGVDAARGLAVLLMILDHVLVVVQASGRLSGESVEAVSITRYTLTRASLPLFMVCSGAVLALRPMRFSRLARVAAVAALVNLALLSYPVGVWLPEVLAVWCAVMVLAPVLRRFPVAAGCVGVVQVYAWHLPWAGYQPGVLVVCLALGVLGGPACLEWAARLPAWLRCVGRFPLSWYCGHLLVVAGLYTVLA